MYFYQIVSSRLSYIRSKCTCNCMYSVQQLTHTAHRITLHSTRFVFDPSQYDGLPLNVMALMPVLIHHFDQPTEFCIKVVSNIQQVRACMYISPITCSVCVIVDRCTYHMTNAPYIMCTLPVMFHTQMIFPCFVGVYLCGPPL